MRHYIRVRSVLQKVCRTSVTNFRDYGTHLFTVILFASVNPMLMAQTGGTGRAGHVASGLPLSPPSYTLMHHMKVYRIDLNIQPPSPLGTPHVLQSAGLDTTSGTVLVSLIVDRRGRVRFPTITRGLGAPYDTVALESVQQWKFHPAVYNEVPVAVSLTVSICFDDGQGRICSKG